MMMWFKHASFWVRISCSTIMHIIPCFECTWHLNNSHCIIHKTMLINCGEISTAVWLHHWETRLGNNEFLPAIFLIFPCTHVVLYSGSTIEPNGWRYSLIYMRLVRVKKKLWSWHDLNMQPSDLESDALPLRHRIIAVLHCLISVVFMLWQWVIASCSCVHKETPHVCIMYEWMLVQVYVRLLHKVT